MKTLRALLTLAAFAAAVSAPLLHAKDDAKPRLAQLAAPDFAVPLSAYDLPSLDALMRKELVLQEPGSYKSTNADGEKRKIVGASADQRRHYRQLMRFVRGNIAAGKTGSEGDPPTLTLTVAEWIRLFGLASGQNESSMGGWAMNAASPRLAVRDALGGFATSIALKGAEATTEEKLMLGEVRAVLEVLKKLNNFEAGGEIGNNADKATLKAFAEKFIAPAK